MKKTILASLLIFSSLTAAATEFFVVVPMKGKAATKADITVSLNPFSLPDGEVNVPYTAFDFKSLLQVTGDSDYNPTNATFSASSLPQGFQLSESGILSGTPTVKNTTGASFQVSATYKTKSDQETYSMIVNGNAVSCLALKQLQPSAADGLYTLMPDGVTAIQTYCDMSNGGWTLVARRNYNTTTGSATTAFTSSNPTTPSFLPDATWVALKSNATLLRVVGNGAPLSSASIMHIAKVMNANCTPLAASLAQAKLFHNEASGCSITGLDYTLLGVTNLRPSYISNMGSVQWDVAIDSNVDYPNLTVWVK